jgi:hypothetical protein
MKAGDHSNTEAQLIVNVDTGFVVQKCWVCKDNHPILIPAAASSSTSPTRLEDDDSMGGFSTQKFIDAASSVSNDRALQRLKTDIMQEMNKYFTYVKATTSYAVEVFAATDARTSLREVMYDFKNLPTLKNDWRNQSLSGQYNKVNEKGKKEEVKFKIQPYNLWMDSRSRPDKFGIKINPRAYLDPESHADPLFFNLFNGWSYNDDGGVAASDDHPFFKHILHNVCSGKLSDFNWFMNWFAHAYQKPWIKMGTSIIMGGTEGTGKGAVVEAMADVMGSRYFVQPTSADDVIGSFNALMFGKLLCFIDEMVWGGDKQKAGVIKKLITEKTMTINKKNIPKITTDNLMNIVIASNEEWVVPAGLTARRFFVCDVNQTLLETTAEEKKEIFTIDRQQLANYLARRDISSFVHRIAPITAGLRHQKILGLDKIHKWWLDKLTSGRDDTNGSTCCFGFDRINSKAMMFEDYKQTSRDSHRQQTSFWIQMLKIIGQVETTRSSKEGRERMIRIPPLATMRNRWRALVHDDEWPFY